MNGIFDNFFNDADHPEPVDVRQGVAFGNGAFTGTLIVSGETTCDYPSESQVAAGVVYGGNTLTGSMDVGTLPVDYQVIVGSCSCECSGQTAKWKPNTTVEIRVAQQLGCNLNAIVDGNIKATFVPCVSWAPSVSVDLEKTSGSYELPIPELAVGVRYRVAFEIRIPDPNAPDDSSKDTVLSETIRILAS